VPQFDTRVFISTLINPADGKLLYPKRVDELKAALTRQDSPFPRANITIRSYTKGLTKDQDGALAEQGSGKVVVE
jgi:hypothetical protein